MCTEAGVGLRMYEIDVLVGGLDHDLLDMESQEAWLSRVEQGDFDFEELTLLGWQWESGPLKGLLNATVKP